MKCNRCGLLMKKDRVAGVLRCDNNDKNRPCANAGVPYRLAKMDRRTRVLVELEEPE